MKKKSSGNLNELFFIESAKKDHFLQTYTWYAITEDRENLTAQIDNVTIIFIRPTPDSSSTDRLGTMQTTFNLKVI